MKKFLAILLCVAMTAAIVACGGTQTPGGNDSESGSQGGTQTPSKDGVSNEGANADAGWGTLEPIR